MEESASPNMEVRLPTPHLPLTLSKREPCVAGFDLFYSHLLVLSLAFLYFFQITPSISFLLENVREISCSQKKEKNGTLLVQF